jgi:hypothetical protein
MIARVTEMEHLTRVDAEKRRKINKAEKGSTIGLVEPKKAASKKKADSTKKKPSKG